MESHANSQLNKCPRCGKSFGSVQELQEHQKNCKQRQETLEQVETDALVEDRFEATDN